MLQMHHTVFGHPGVLQVDHANRNPLDNRRCNLRLATQSQNQLNREAPLNNTSGYKGVSWGARQRKWRAHFRGKHLGFFDSPSGAHGAYLKAAQHAGGEFAHG